jgi:outer membrane protein
LRATLVLLPLLLPTAAYPAEDWTVRVGASKYHPKGKNGQFENALLPGTDLELDVENGFGVSVDLSRMLTERWALELMVQLPSEHLVKFEHGPGVGNGTVGEMKRVTTILSAQYHMNPDGRWRPYLGAGVQASFFFDEKGLDYLSGESLQFKDALGVSGQIGLDIMFAQRWLLNLSARYLLNESELKLNGQKLTDADITGLLWGLHLGFKF